MHQLHDSGPSCAKLVRHSSAESIRVRAEQPVAPKPSGIISGFVIAAGFKGFVYSVEAVGRRTGTSAGDRIRLERDVPIAVCAYSMAAWTFRVWPSAHVLPSLP